MGWQQRPCKNTLCNAVTHNDSGYCNECTKDRPEPSRQPRQRLTAHKRGYDNRWRKARANYLSDNPLCVMCKQRGKVTAAIVVDHIKPHKGSQELFWDQGNWQALCKRCHDSDKQKAERGPRPG